MQVSEIWLTPDQAAAISGRSMIAIRALIQATSEDDGTKHLLQIFEDGPDGTQYRLHRSLVTAEGLRMVGPEDLVEVLSKRVEALESEVEVLRLRSSSVRTEQSESKIISNPSPPQLKPTMTNPITTTQANGASFWVILASIIFLTIVVILYILYKQGFLTN